MSAPEPRKAPPAATLDLRGRLALTLPEVARALGVSERHVRDLRAELPCITLGRRVVIPVEALRAWLQSRVEAERAGGLQGVEEVLGSLGENAYD